MDTMTEDLVPIVYPAEIDWHAPLTARPVHELLEAAAARHPENPAMDFLGRAYSYGETLDLVERAAEGLQSLGVTKGTRVGLCLPNTPYMVIAYYAILKAGGVVVNFNPLYTARELSQQAADANIAVMVTLDLEEIYAKVAELPEAMGLRKIVVCPICDILPTLKGMLCAVLNWRARADIPGDDVHITFNQLTDNGGAPLPVDINPHEDAAVLQYTGGTTGLPKAARLSHANVSVNTEQVKRWCTPLGDGRDRVMTVLPLFHVFAMTVAMNLGISVAAELILLPKFDLGDMLKTIDRKKPTVMPGVPTLYAAILDAPGLERFDLTSIEACISGGAPLPPDIKTRFEAATGCDLVEGYGLSETSPVLTCNPLGTLNKPGSVGLPLPGTVIEIRDPETPSRVLGRGQAGEICARGPQVMGGYLNRPDETTAAFHDGAFRTGDIGYLDADGYLFIIDRIKDVILSAGYNIYPRIIEDAIQDHPDVAEVIVIGVPHPRRGEVPKAFVRLNEGAELTTGELTRFLEDILSTLEIPRHIEFRDALPKTAVGKLSKKDLIEQETLPPPPAAPPARPSHEERTSP